MISRLPSRRLAARIAGSFGAALEEEMDNAYKLSVTL
jgi:hypothetical protein